MKRYRIAENVFKILFLSALITICILLSVENRIHIDGELVEAVSFVDALSEGEASSPNSEALAVVVEQERVVSAYNAGDIDQTDSSPCVSANGSNICILLEQGINVCAANWVPFKTILEIEGLGECIVLDRMAKRNGQKVDWAMKLNEKSKALNFGVKTLSVKIIK